MDRRIGENLRGEHGNYLLPFLWLAGEDRDTLRREVLAIRASGARAFCLESRVYEKFGEPEWFADCGFLLELARELDMRVFLLDDKSFPTGYANGAIARRRPDLRPWLLREFHIDVPGPGPGVSFPFAGRLEAQFEESIAGAVALRRTGGADFELDAASALDLGDRLADGRLYWDAVPPGDWRVFFLVKTRRRHYNTDYAAYIDMLNPASVELQIEAVYEPFFRHFRGYFGNVFAGFFSDEPCFGNDSRGYDCRIGKRDMELPWCDELAALLPVTGWPGLWYPVRGEGEVRVRYMDFVTRRYENAFSRRLGDWCRAHGVLYLGHVIEDCGSHTALGPSAGHYFRNLAGQDMAGVDVVLQQLLPGQLRLPYHAPLWGGVSDPVFFHDVLAKLASSLAAIAPGMAGRAFCEAFGGYGWVEDLPQMKYIADVMVANGINHFIPHAFSPRYPNPDCPPHFFCGGANPGFGGFTQLMHYMQRLCHLFNGGRRICPAAVLYHAESEWLDSRRAMRVDAVAAGLLRNQLDFDILPADVLDRIEVVGNDLVLNGNRYRALIVPAGRWPDAVRAALTRLEARGGRVVMLKHVRDIGRAVARFRAEGWMPVALDKACPRLRVMHYRRDGEALWFCLNLDPERPFRGRIAFPEDAPSGRYDASANTLTPLRGHGTAVELELAPLESTVLCSGAGAALPAGAAVKTRTLRIDWSVALKPFDAAEFEPYRPGGGDITAPGGGRERFYGTIRYQGEFELAALRDWESLVFPAVGGFIDRVELNGVELGRAVAPPFRLALRGALRTGCNRLTVDVINARVFLERDAISQHTFWPPSGLLEDSIHLK